MVRIAEFCGLVLFASLWLLGASQLRAIDPFLIVLSLPLAYYLADLFSGLVHWVCDSFGTSETFVLGPALIKPFRDHHKNPQDITRISLVENLGASGIAGTVVMLLARPAFAAAGSPLADFSLCLLWWFVAFAFLSNLFHRWAHIPFGKRPRWIRGLQTLGLVLDSQAHGIHHQRPHRRNYCILCGWANGLTNAVPWSSIEGQLLKIGIRTNFD